MLAVSQYMTSLHGQGKINLELLLGFKRRGFDLSAVASWVDDKYFAGQGALCWRPIRVSSRVPTNWARESLFAYLAGRLCDVEGDIVVNNGAAVVRPSRINIAMFVHAAWYNSPWHPRRETHFYAKYQALYSASQIPRERKAFKLADTIVALSDVVKDEIIRWHHIDESKIVVIEPGIDSNLFRPRLEGDFNLLRESCGLAGRDELLGIFVGESQTPRKNLDLVLRALRLKDNVHVAVVGSVGARYGTLVESWGLQSRVHFLGQRTDVSELMRGADLFVLPTHYEPFGMVILEAMASGLPVIVTRQAGAASLISHGEQGFLLADGDDIDGLADAIEYLSDAQNRREIGAAARLAAIACTWDAMTDQYLRILQPG